MKCSECGGQIIFIQYALYCPNGNISGEYKCRRCGAIKKWFIPVNGEPVIDMSSSPTSRTTEEKC